MDILETIKEILKGALHKDDRAYLYGSRARGTSRSDSDWDILIVLNKDKIRTEDYDTVSYPLTSLGWELDEVISPVLYTASEWADQRQSLFYKNIQKDAIRLI